MNIKAIDEFIEARATRQDRSQMQELTELAYATVFEALRLEWGADDASSENERRHCTARAGVGADYLFGREPDSRATALDLGREQEAVRNWLKRDAPMCELVLETLRVYNALTEHRPPSTGPIGEGLLMAYGQGSFRTPDLATYDTLVHRALYRLPLHAQQRILYRLGKTQSCH